MWTGHLSKRLLAVARYVPLRSRLLDVGSDHAYLPIYLAQNKLIHSGVASEVAPGPYRNMVDDIQAAGVANVISARLANGLAAVNRWDRFNVITIAGMGGSLITKILDHGIRKLIDNPLLILQPNVGAGRLRKWLMQHRCSILHENIVKDDHHIYEIIVAQRCKKPVHYDADQLFFGPLLLRQRGPIFRQKWLNEIQHLRLVLEAMQRAKKLPLLRIHQLKKKIKMIKRVIKI